MTPEVTPFVPRRTRRMHNRLVVLLLVVIFVEVVYLMWRS